MVLNSLFGILGTFWYMCFFKFEIPEFKRKIDKKQ